MTRAEVLAELDRRLALIPPDFVDDGCSAPWILRVLLPWLWRRLRPACRCHDWYGCTRAWPAGALDQAHRQEGDTFLGESARASVVLGLRWTAWGIHQAVDWWNGYRAYDSCGASAGERCRHNLPRPAWMGA